MSVLIVAIRYCVCISQVLNSHASRLLASCFALSLIVGRRCGLHPVLIAFAAHFLSRSSWTSLRDRILRRARHAKQSNSAIPGSPERGTRDELNPLRQRATTKP